MSDNYKTPVTRWALWLPIFKIINSACQVLFLGDAISLYANLLWKVINFSLFPGRGKFKGILGYVACVKTTGIGEGKL